MPAAILVSRSSPYYWPAGLKTQNQTATAGTLEGNRCQLQGANWTPEMVPPYEDGCLLTLPRGSYDKVYQMPTPENLEEEKGK